jgi:hypothetical protein
VNQFVHVMQGKYVLLLGHHRACGESTTCVVYSVIGRS